MFMCLTFSTSCPIEALCQVSVHGGENLLSLVRFGVLFPQNNFMDLIEGFIRLQTKVFPRYKFVD